MHEGATEEHEDTPVAPGDQVSDQADGASEEPRDVEDEQKPESD